MKYHVFLTIQVCVLCIFIYNNYWKTGALATSLIYLHRIYKKNTVQIFYQKNQQNEQVLKNCPSLYDYRPTFYLNGFLHTIIGVLLPCHIDIKSEKEKIDDSGISVDWVLRDSNNDQLFIILPGLTGQIDDSYINSIVKEAIRKGFKNICVYNYRMLSPEVNFFFIPDSQDYGLDFNPNKFQSQFQDFKFAGKDNDYHFLLKNYIEGQRSRVDLVADLHHTLNLIKQKYKFNKIFALGCSYGANQLCSYLGRFESKALVNAAVSVCAPYSMALCNIYITKIMDLVLCYLLKAKLKTLKHIFEQGKYPKNWDLDVEGALNTWDIREFDQLFSSKIYGYKSADHYYRHFSPINWIGNARVPLLCISAMDDDVCHEKAVGRDEILLNPQAILCMTGLGGHVGFIEGIIPSRFWFPKPSIEFLKQFA